MLRDVGENFPCQAEATADEEPQSFVRTELRTELLVCRADGTPTRSWLARGSTPPRDAAGGAPRTKALAREVKGASRAGCSAARSTGRHPCSEGWRAVSFQCSAARCGGSPRGTPCEIDALAPHANGSSIRWQRSRGRRPSALAGTSARHRGRLLPGGGKPSCPAASLARRARRTWREAAATDCSLAGLIQDCDKQSARRTETTD